MTQIALLGANGMLGQTLKAKFSSDNLRFAGRGEVDITQRRQLEDFIPSGATVVNAAAYTQVDQAESNRDEAFAINATAVGVLSEVVRQKGARLIHVSTDYAFSGNSSRPYEEDDLCEPATVYGESKRAGEVLVREILPESGVIVRTAWLYGHPGSSFPKTILKLGTEQEQIQVVDDQFGQPTWTHDVAEMISQLVSHEIRSGVFHATNSGQTTWWGLARQLFSLAGWDPERVKAVSSESFQRPAPRPRWSVLGHENWRKSGIDYPRPWEDALNNAWERELRFIASDFEKAT